MAKGIRRWRRRALVAALVLATMLGFMNAVSYSAWQAYVEAERAFAEQPSLSFFQNEFQTVHGKVDLRKPSPLQSSLLDGMSIVPNWRLQAYLCIDPLDPLARYIVYEEPAP